MWINIFDELPKKSNPVLVYMTQSVFKFVTVCYLSEGLQGLVWIVCGHNYPVINQYPFEYATHWCDIPYLDQLADLNKTNISDI